MKESNTHSAPMETPAGVSPGMLLKAARQEQGLSVVDVAARLCLSVQVIEDIERDDYSHMSAKVYARGHVMSYAHILGIPESKILSALANVRMEFAPVKTPVALDNEKSIPIYQPIETPHQRSGLMLWGSILVLVILIGLVLMWGRGPATPPAPPTKVTPVATVAPVPTTTTIAPQPQLSLPLAPAAPAGPVVPMVKSVPTPPPPSNSANKTVLQPSEFRDPKRLPPSSTVASSDPSSTDLPPPRASDNHP